MQGVRIEKSKTVDQIEAALAHLKIAGTRFKEVARDEGALRTLKVRTRHGFDSDLSIPLVFAVPIPAPPVVSVQVQTGSETWMLATCVPIPPAEALKHLKAVREEQLFDSFECWWVPQRFSMVSSRPTERDPILVGIVKTPFGKNRCIGFRRPYADGYESILGTAFEIYRWEDETYEDPYWAKEGY